MMTSINEAVAEACRQFNLTCSVTEDALGRGRFGEVFKATSNVTGKEHALKISFSDMTDPRVFDYLKGEAELHKKLRHKNIVRIYNSYVTPQFVAIDMELCHMSLMDYVKRYGVVLKKGDGSLIPDRKGLKESDARAFTRDILRGLLFVHKQGIFHRDIKPENILIVQNDDGSFTAKISDFGLAKPLEESTQTRLGTPLYAAPEVLGTQGEGQYDTLCDLWSLGITLYVLLSGTRPQPPSYSLPRELKFSDCCKHFLSNLLVANPRNRFSALDALHHPFAMPGINYMQLIKPNSVLHTVSCRIHRVELGDIAFRNAVCRSTVGSLFSQTAAKNIQWTVSWADVVDMCDLSDAGDITIITNGGKCCRKNELVEFSEDFDINVLFVSSKAPISLIDPDSVAKNNSSSLQKGSTMGTNVQSVNFFLKELKSRYSFCEYTLLRHSVLDHFRGTVSLDLLIKTLFEVQNDVLKQSPDFPVLSLTQPENPVFRIPELLDGESAELEGLLKEIENIKDTVQHKASAQFHTSFPDEVDALKKLMTNPNISVYMNHAVRTFNDMLTAIQPHVDLLIRLTDYIDLLKSVMGNPHPQSVYPKLINVIKDCPYLHLSVGNIPYPYSVPETPNELVDLMKKIILEQQNQFAALQSQVTELRERNQKMIDESLNYTEQSKVVISHLQSVLSDHGIALHSGSGDDSDDDQFHV